LRVRIFTIEKSEDKDIESMLKEYQKMSQKFCSLEFIKLFDKTLAASQRQGGESAKESYEKAYLPYFDNFIKMGVRHSFMKNKVFVKNHNN